MSTIINTPAYQAWVEQQFKAGKPLLSKFKTEATWQSVLDPSWDWKTFDYRIDCPPLSVTILCGANNRTFQQVGIKDESDLLKYLLLMDKDHPEDAPHRIVTFVEPLIKQGEDFEAQVTAFATSFK
jgi:hypothetical protein